jgi:hypothetical protein
VTGLTLHVSDNAALYIIQIKEAGHEANLVQSGLQKEAAKIKQAPAGQIPPSVQIPLPGRVRTRQSGKTPMFARHMAM